MSRCMSGVKAKEWILLAIHRFTRPSLPKTIRGLIGGGGVLCDVIQGLAKGRCPFIGLASWVRDRYYLLLLLLLRVGRYVCI